MNCEYPVTDATLAIMDDQAVLDYNVSSLLNCTDLSCICDEACIRRYSDSFELLSSWTETCIVTPYVIVTALSIICNIVIVIVILNNNKLRTTHNYLIANLAVSDLLLTIFCVPSTLLMILNESRWTLGLLLCKVSQFYFDTKFK